MGTGYHCTYLTVYIYIYSIDSRPPEIARFSWESFGRALCGKSIRDKTVTLPSFLLFLREVYGGSTVGGFTPEGDNYSK